jgi:hypothetical protein
MSDTGSQHSAAMEKADEAMVARRENRLEDANRLFREALRLESEAAMTLMESLEEEPTRSVLFRSAASLAINGEMPAYAAYLIACGLEGNPPPEIREELRGLLRTVRVGTAGAGAVSDAEGRDADRLRRVVSSWSDVWFAIDDMRKTLPAIPLFGAQLSNFLLQQILGSIRDALRQSTGDGQFSLYLFAIDPGASGTWVSLALPPTVSDDGEFIAKYVAFECGESLLRGGAFAAAAEVLADRDVVSIATVRAASEAGFHAIAAWPVRVVDDQQRDRPALALVGLASHSGVFADEMTRESLRHCVCLLELAIEIGRRDDVLARENRSRSESGRPRSEDRS